MSASFSRRGSVLSCVAYLTVCVLQTVAVHAQEERTTAVLRYGRGPELVGCPSDASLRRSVAAHLGYDPFQNQRGIVVDASIERASPGLIAHVQARGEDGAPLGQRELRSEQGDCVELSRALALAISVAIDPFVLSRAEPQRPAEATTEPVPEATPTPAASEAQADRLEPEATSSQATTPSDAQRRKARPYLSLDAVFGWGFVPAPRGALAVVSLWPLRGPWLLHTELRYDLPGSDAGPEGGEVRASLASARVSVCAGANAWGACLGSAQGVLLASGAGVDDVEQARAWLPAASLFGYVHVWRRGPWLVQLRAGADVPLRRVSLDINGESAFTSPRIGPYGALGVGRTLP